MVFVRYDSVSDILKPSGDPGVTDYSRYAGTGEITVHSQVIAAAVAPADVYQLDHVAFTLRHSEVKRQDADFFFLHLSNEKHSPQSSRVFNLSLSWL